MPYNRNCGMMRSNSSRVGIVVLMGAFSIILIEMCRQFATRTYRLFGLYDLQNPDFTLYGGAACLSLLLIAVWLIVNKDRNTS